ncbi:LOW QUALITY PROTEIN: CAIB/BAIF family protein [Bacillus sp. JCM 19045]|nr:LOW QUALITY PROTEIN: CAIB/BAIF family protein [Bacillus sp. JCM 19045]
MTQSSALADLKILDISTMLAAPWASTYLADFGAEVVKVEHPQKGDHARNYGKKKGDISLFWKTLNRNKKCITLNLSQPKGQELFKELLPHFDVVIENFRPGTLEKWNIGWSVMQEINPSLVLLRTTGYGQEGPYANRGGFGTVAEAMSGFTSVNGPADGPPTLPGMSLADGVSSAFGALSVMIALHERAANGRKEGQCIDISLYEPLMRFLEPHLVAYDQLGEIAQRVATAACPVAPRNAYQTKEGKWVAISGAAQSIAANVFKAIGQPELIDDPRFKTNADRVANSVELDKYISAWIGAHLLEEVVATFSDAGAVVGPMHDMSQLFEDAHFQARETFIKMSDDELGEVRIPNVVSKFSRTPGKVTHLGAKLGEHSDDVLSTYLQLDEATRQQLRQDGII